MDIWFIPHFLVQLVLYAFSDLTTVFLYTIQILAVVFTLYQTFISYLGFRKRQPVKLAQPQKRFALIVAAHNEETVIGQIIESLKALDYPKELYDIYVVCDNCTDRTEDIVHSKGIKALVRCDLEKTGKGYALEWAFKQLWHLSEQKNLAYDAVAMFDADNLVSKNFLGVVNSKLLEGFEVIQAYLDAKNPKDTWITQAYSFSYWATNRVYQLSRENLGLSAQLGGTGVIVATRVLQQLGWGSTSLTEDLEFTQRYILASGKRVAWVHEAKVYDEKPLTFLASWKQRVRWMSGHVDCMKKYTVPLVKKAWKERNFLCLDTAMYLLQPSRILISVVLIMYTILSFVNLVDIHPLFDRWTYLIITGFYHLLPVIGLVLEKQTHAILWIIKTYLFSYSWIPIVIVGFIRHKNQHWVHTKHVRSMSIEDVEECNSSLELKSLEANDEVLTE